MMLITGPMRRSQIIKIKYTQRTGPAVFVLIDNSPPTQPSIPAHPGGGSTPVRDPPRTLHNKRDLIQANKRT